MRPTLLLRTIGGHMQRGAVLRATLAAAIVIGLPGCAADSGARQPAPTTVTETVTASPSTATLSSMTATSEQVASPTPSTSVTGVLPATATGRPLSLSEFFQPDGEWSEDRYDIASQSGVQGAGVTLQSCYENQAQVLELRLSNAFSTLSFSVGQANDSKTSTLNLVVEVVANNRQIDIQRVPFNKVQTFVEPATSVNAVQIRLYPEAATGNCGYDDSIVGVVSGVTLT